MTQCILRSADVSKLIRLSRSTIWRLERAGQFPQRRQISPGAVGWVASEVYAWLDSRPSTSSEKEGE